MWGTVDISAHQSLLTNITFEVPRLSTFVFKKSSEKRYSRLYSWLRKTNTVMFTIFCLKTGLGVRELLS